jgi:hypothetical protein
MLESQDHETDSPFLDKQVEQGEATLPPIFLPSSTYYLILSELLPLSDSFSAFLPCGTVLRNASK